MAEITRNAGVDFGRVIAFAAIVVLHSYPNFGPSEFTILAWDQLPRFAVPFFFISSGYFLWPKIDDPKIVRRGATRSMYVFIFWVILYNLRAPENLLPTAWFDTFRMGGQGFHLWFLTALAIAIVAAYALVSYIGIKVACAVAAVCFFMSVLSGAYGVYIPILSEIGNRNGLFFGFPFLVMGMAFAKYGQKPRASISFAIFALGAALLLAESYLIRGADLTKAGDLFFSTAIFGAGSFLFFSGLDGPITKLVGSFGPIVLGAYAIHVFFLWFLDGYSGVAGWITFISLTFICAMASSLVLSRTPFIRRFVS